MILFNTSLVSEVKTNGEVIRNSDFGKAFLAGSISGTISTFLFQPLDVVKTQKQRYPDLRKNVGYRQIIIAIGNEGGLSSFWRGLTASLLRSVPGVGLYFSSLHYIKNNFIRSKPSPVQLMLAGVAARSITSTVFIPFTVIKTRLESSDYKYNGVVHAVRSIHAEEGVRGFTRGLLPTVIRDAPYSGIYLMFYDTLKLVSTVLFVEESGDLKSSQIFSCGVAAGCMASVITHPADVIKTKMQLYPDKFIGLSSGVLFIYKKYGLNGFTKGLLPRLLRRTLITAISWTVYEKIAVYLSLK